MSQIHFIYKTTCLLTNKYYIGMHSAKKLDDGYMGSGKLLHHSIKKHGSQSHKREVLFYAVDKTELADLERAIVTLDLLNDPLCMNLRLGGVGGFSLECYTTRAKLNQDPEWSKRVKLKTALLHPNFWRAGQAAMALAARSPEARAKRAETYSKTKFQQGEKNSQFGSRWVNNGTKNKKIGKDEPLEEGWSLGRAQTAAKGKDRAPSYDIGSEKIAALPQTRPTAIGRRLRGLVSSGLTGESWLWMMSQYKIERLTKCREPALRALSATLAAEGYSFSPRQLAMLTLRPILDMTLQEYKNAYCTQIRRS